MMVNIFILLGFSLFGFSLGAPNCANPCSDLWVASDCNKVQHCIKNDWSRLKPTGKTDSVCDICLRMVKEARDVLQSKETEDQLKQVFEGSCKLLILKPAVDFCDKIADEFVPKLVEVLSSQMDPETVCTVAKLCNNEALREMQKNSEDCKDCRKFMMSAKEKMKFVSKEDYRENLIRLCRNAGAFTDACYGVAKTYSDLLYNHTKMALEGTSCEATLLCPSGTGSEVVEDGKCSITSRKRMCPMCLKVTEDIVEQLTRTKSAEDYRENFMKVCSRLRFPESFCAKAAENTQLYNFLKENGKSVSRFFCYKSICEEKPSVEFPVWPLLPVNLAETSIEAMEDVVLRLLVDFIREDGAEHIREDIELNLGEDVEPCEETDKTVAAPVDCQECELTIKKIIQVVGGEKKEDLVKRPLSEACYKFPKRSQEKCLVVVNAHNKPVLDVILQHSSAYEACEKMKYCSGKRKESSLKSISYGDPIDNPIFFAPILFSPVYESDCTICKDISHMLADYVNTNNTYMNQALGVACLLSKNLKKCSNFLESYSPDISRSFAKYLSSRQVCQDVIPSCAGKENEIVPKGEATEHCQNCKTWVEGVTSILLDSKNLEMMRATFGASCEKFSQEEQVRCRYFAKRNSERILNSILEGLRPDKACGNLNYCEKKQEELEEKTSLSSVTTPLKDVDAGKVPCKFCLLVMKTLLDQLENDKTEAAIRNALKTLCNYFPEETRHTCENIIDEYAEDLVDMIIADFNPSEICVKLKICKPTNINPESNKMLSVQTFDIKTNEVRDDEETKRLSELISKRSEADSALLERVHAAVQECALCEALVQVISSHKEMLVKNYNFSENASNICRIVPRRKKRQCMSMVVSYGPSIVNLIVDKNVEPDDVCLQLTLCDASMNAKVNMPVSVPEPQTVNNDCLKGPSFWCANENNARECGTYLHCKEMVWKKED